MFTKTFTVEKFGLIGITERFEQLKKTATKLGLATPTLDVEPGAPIYSTDIIGRQIVADGYDVKITTGPLRFDGWHLLATITATPTDGTLISRTNRFDTTNLDMFDGKTCTHCGTNRARSLTFVVRHDDGRIVQVGKSCAKDFLGHSLAGIMGFVEQVDGFGDNLGNTSSGWIFPLTKMVSVASASIALDGFRKASDDGSTAQVVRSCMTDSDKFDRLAARVREAGVELPEVAGVVAEMGSFDGADFARNVAVLARCNFVRLTDAALVAAGVKAAIATKPAVVDVVPCGGHVGEVGDVVSADVVVVAVRAFESSFGWQVLATFKDAAGNVFKVFTGLSTKLGRVLGEVSVGARFLLAGTVKVHEVWDGRPATVLTRAKVC